MNFIVETECMQVIIFTIKPKCTAVGNDLNFINFIKNESNEYIYMHIAICKYNN